MRKILTFAAGLIIITACAQKSPKAIVKSEPTTITWIEDKPGPTLQPQKLYPEVPDSLWAALGLEKGQHQKHQRPERGIFPRSFNIIPTYKNV